MCRFSAKPIAWYTVNLSVWQWLRAMLPAPVSPQKSKIASPLFLEVSTLRFKFLCLAAELGIMIMELHLNNGRNSSTLHDLATCKRDLKVNSGRTRWCICQNLATSESRGNAWEAATHLKLYIDFSIIPRSKWRTFFGIAFGCQNSRFLTRPPAAGWTSPMAPLTSQP